MGGLTTDQRNLGPQSRGGTREGAVRSAPATAKAAEPPVVRLSLLGRFRAEHTSVISESAWQQRRSAKMLVKLLATHPGHTLHREQVLELLWPEVDFPSAVNSFGKALHVARRALEPGLPRRGISTYLRLVDDVISLVAERVWVDADHFQMAAEEAMRRGDVASFERALALYTGQLLPEDTYESWSIARRDALADLHLRVLLGLANALERRGDRAVAIERLTQVLQLDPAREDVHRQLMRMHAECGRRGQALRQYQLCCEALSQELDAQPESATVALYEEIRTGQIRQGATAAQAAYPATEAPALPVTIQRLPSTPLFGREGELRLLTDALRDAESGRGSAVMVSGETGVGKTRLVVEAARDAADKRALVLWGVSHKQDRLLPYGPFAEAVETYVATCDLSMRQLLAARYPELVCLVPSLSLESEQQPRILEQETERSQLFTALVRLLTDLASRQTLVLVLDDIHEASWESIQLLRHLTHLASQRRWLILGTYREEDVTPGSELQQILTSGIREGFCRHVNLRRLARDECNTLLHSLIGSTALAPTLREHVYSASLGNPLFILELVGAMQGRGELVLANGCWQIDPSVISSVPRQVGKLVDAYVQPMENRAQRVLSLVAVAGAKLSFDELCLAAYEAIDPEISETELLDMLDAALQSRILEEKDAGYAFTHPLFRAALCENLSKQRRAQLHGAVAHAIEAYRPNDVENLNYHYDKSTEQERATVRRVRCAPSRQSMEELETAYQDQVGIA